MAQKTNSVEAIPAGGLVAIIRAIRPTASCGEAMVALFQALPDLIRRPGFTWKEVFQALNDWEIRGEDRFTLISEIFKFKESLLIKNLRLIASSIQYAGIHPLSLLLCCRETNECWHSGLLKVFSEQNGSQFLKPIVGIRSNPGFPRGRVGWELQGLKSRNLPDNLLSCHGPGYFLAINREGNGNLKALGNDWAIVGDMKIQDLPNLQKLGDGLNLFGNLELDDLPALRTLGKGIKISGNLVLRRCENLRSLPRGLQVGGLIAVYKTDIRRFGTPQNRNRTVRHWQSLPDVPNQEFPVGVQTLISPDAE